jgi:hypothetical protein
MRLSLIRIEHFLFTHITPKMKIQEIFEKKVEIPINKWVKILSRCGALGG